MPEIEAERRRWMSHYWESETTDKGNKPLTQDSLEARIAELSAEVAKRRESGKQHESLIEEMHWRERQLDRLKGM